MLNKKLKYMSDAENPKRLMECIPTCLPFMEHVPTSTNTVAVTSSGLLNWNKE